MEKKTKILMFDDDEDNLHLCSEILTHENYEVQTFISCRGLLEKVASYKPHIIIMDNEIGEINGTEAIPLLKSVDKYKSIPVILFSSSNDLEYLAKNIGADATLQKPCNIHDLLKKVRSVNILID